MIKYLKGDVLKISPFPSVILHSCNCQGRWGGGVARAIALEFASAEEIHKKYCSNYQSDPRKLLGLSQVISTSRGDEGNRAVSLTPSVETKFILCLFTSNIGGSKADRPSSILQNTEKALKNLEAKLFCDEADLHTLTDDREELQAILKLRSTFDLNKDRLVSQGPEGDRPDSSKLDIYLPLINSGIFHTPWDDTEHILKRNQKYFNYNVVVL
ncbi:ADP-ribose 1''-phosphate phosphatase [Saccharomycopsis crataegensis]|uniref:ADP-ribose 1''-phosphate phosphatase n=1 Tax=Saccharomycopsis crataegensis TaxID=43959 RepID=A0AAV5QH52_9ASCO|nr:ADP-ribose 1''-phosphate phosphatase [Saccharomycopsis crataegensis]